MTSFLDDLQRQLVEASRGLAAPRSAATRRSPRWPRSLRRSSLVLIAALAVAGSALAATTQLLGNQDESLRVVEQLATIPEGTEHAYVRANGLDPTDAKRVFSTPAGLSVYAVGDRQATCIIVSDGDQQCYRATALRSGLGLSIGADCSAGGDRRLRIAGTAPAGTESVRVAYSSGAGHAADVVDRVFLIDTTTPAPGEPHPVALEAHGAAGTTLARRPIPDGGDLCLGRPSS